MLISQGDPEIFAGEQIVTGKIERVVAEPDGFGHHRIESGSLTVRFGVDDST